MRNSILKRLQIHLLAAGILLSMGCYTAPRMEQFQKQREIYKPFTEVWDAVVESLADSEMPVESIERESGLITTDMVSVSPYECSCMKGLLITSTQWRGKLNVYVKTVSDTSTTVKINTHFEAFDSQTTKSWFACNSTGKVEAIFFRRLAELLGE